MDRKAATAATVAMKVYWTLARPPSEMEPSPPVLSFDHSGTPILPSKDRTRKRIGKQVATLNQSKWARDGEENPTNSTLRKASNIFGS